MALPQNAPSRFRNRGADGGAGPVEGAIACIPIQFASVAAAVSGTSTTVEQKITFPAGMIFKLSSIQVSAFTVTSDPALTIGTSAAGTQIVASVNVTSTLGAVTLKATELSGSTYIRIVTDTGDSYRSATVNLVGYWKAMPNAMAVRNSAHY